MPRGGGRSGGGRSPSAGRSSGGGFFSRGPARAPAAAPRPPMQQPRPSPMAAPQQQSGGMMSGLAGTVMTGMAFGAGSEIAHQGVRSLMGGSGSGSAPAQQQAAPQEGGQMAPAQGGQYQDFSAEQQQQQEAHPCMDFNTNFIQCLKMNA